MRPFVLGQFTVRTDHYCGRAVLVGLDHLTSVHAGYLLVELSDARHGQAKGPILWVHVDQLTALDDEARAALARARLMCEAER